MISKLASRLTEDQWRVIRYIAVGGWNTVFGMGVYAALYWLYGEKVHYLLLAVPSNIMAITNAYVCYKLFVFKTEGCNVLWEYLRCYLVYGGGALAGAGLMYACTEILSINPAVSNVAATALVTMASYVGHKYFSFRKTTKPKSQPEDAG